MSPQYIIDTNILVNSYNTLYPMEHFPGYWEFIEHCYNTGLFVSNSLTLSEFKGYGDKLSEWGINNKSFFIPDDSIEVQNNFKNVAECVMSHKIWDPLQKSNFLSGADGFIIAQALTYTATIVTDEIYEPSPNCKKVKIPNVCEKLNVKCINLNQLITTLKPTFYWHS